MITKLIRVLQMKILLKRRQRIKNILHLKDWRQIIFWFLRLNFVLTKMLLHFAKWIDWVTCKLWFIYFCSIWLYFILFLFLEITIEPMPTLLPLLKRENILSTSISVLSILLAVTASNSNSASRRMVLLLIHTLGLHWSKDFIVRTWPRSTSRGALILFSSN